MDAVTKPLVYPYTDTPAFGTTFEVAPGVRWLQMPLPMSLKFINLYLIFEGDGWTVVDTGMRGDDTHQLWWEIFNQELDGLPVKKVICTHMHPDHTGQAGFISEHWKAPLYMSYSEYYQARVMSTMMRSGANWQMTDYFERSGMAPSFLEGMRKNQGSWSMPADDKPLPPSFIRLSAGDVLQLGDNEWQVVVGSGHSPEHVCLYCKELRVFLSGDQILPIITSNVSVQPTEPEGNPLERFMESNERLMNTLPNDILVLPAHNMPFYGIKERCQQLIDHHNDRMLSLEEFCVTPQVAVDMLPILFERALDGHSMFMGLGECIAHLHFLMKLKRIERVLDSGVYTYLSIDPTLKDRARPGKHLAPPERPIVV
ncbi:MAG: MBL fold metallo-hydrolase [Pseudomonadales bacterium]|mgnify:FL=1|jgi:glyoxylase-like metal-dependent hydrolase (beta-lactamase superfamily II)|nr:MBL fold metallo-hydrolase [Pseudomonadales bacterium]MDP7597925.1 MBL fold metallo-hydrolase [Pseudomonadales bacterium]HJN50123.1 MBL fold metallo-hydrolase [Pseudomonadales bacterium]|tara:strand:+ start:50 stop:1159 length:1110 start_codon:yes stop_codon:yes gene_type:complete